MLRIILDTNVLIDAELDENSYPIRIVKLALKGDLLPLVSRRTERENRKILKQLSSDSVYHKVIEDFFTKAEQVEVNTRLKGVTADRDDDKFVELAVDGDADYIITKDHHLLDLGKYEQTEITTPERFWNVYSEVAPNRVRALGY